MPASQGIVIMSNELAHRYAEPGIVSISLNPGNIKTDLQRNTPGFMKVAVSLVFSESAGTGDLEFQGWMFFPAQGALTQLWAGVSPEAVHLNGQPVRNFSRRNKADDDLSILSMGILH